MVTVLAGSGEKRKKEKESHKDAELRSVAKQTVSEHKSKSPKSLLADLTEITL